MIRVWYHANCLDGFGAAYVLWLRFQADGLQDSEVSFEPVNYGEDPPEVFREDKIWMVDFSYKRPVMEEILAYLDGNIGRLTVIDHHKTAAADLEGFPGATFDMEKSGAVLTWEQVFPDQEVPMLLRYIQDADLYRFELDGSRAFRQGLWCEPRDFEHWDSIDPCQSDEVFERGKAILRHVEMEVERISAKATSFFLGGFKVLVANSDGMASALGHELAKRSVSGVGVVWHLDGEIYRWELRSTADGPDVSEIAKAYGGGGHAHAAGFQSAENFMTALRGGGDA